MNTIVRCAVASGLAFLAAACAGSRPKASSPQPPPPVAALPEAAVPPQAMEPPAVVPRFQTIYFDFDRSDIRADQRAALEANVSSFRKSSGFRLTLEGHCDERGTQRYNEALGSRRAQAVRNALVAAGVASNLIEAVSYGETRPVALGSNEDAWARNRRVQFVVSEGVALGGTNDTGGGSLR